MSRSCQPTYVSDRKGSIHIEESFSVQGRDRTSVTRCGVQLNFDKGEAPSRLFHLTYRHLFAEGCSGCADHV